MIMNTEIIPVESIQERDIDLLLIEEINVNEIFLDWLLSEVGLPSCTSLNHALKSVSDFGLGETDILIDYKSGSEQILVLIENKLDASFQDNQFQRYTKRSEKYISTGQISSVATILVAPEQYCVAQSFFEVYLTYESIMDWFYSRNERRATHKALLLKIGIEKLRRGYHPVNSMPVQKFWISYWNYKEKHYPYLRMKKPDIVPHGSDWPEMRFDEFEGIIFYHKLLKGFVDATFCNYSQTAQTEISNHIPPNTKLVKHNKRFSLRMTVPAIDRTKDFEAQLKNIEKGFNSIEFLRNWILEHQFSNLYIK
jgi:hypothetical protein